MGVAVSFVFADWTSRYPEFAQTSPATAALWFNEATVYCRNDGGGPVADTNTQTAILWALTAHIATLSGALQANGAPSGLVGRVSSATEGTVSVQTDMSGIPGSAAWFAQTSYGLNAWQMMAQFRTMRYRAPCQRRFNSFPPY